VALFAATGAVASAAGVNAVLAGQAQSSSFAGAAAVASASPVNAALAATAQSASFAGTGTVAGAADVNAVLAGQAQSATFAGTADVLIPPNLIFASNGTIDAWYEGDAVVTSGGLVTQRTDLSGNGRHQVATGTSPNPARQPTAVASDSRANNSAMVKYQGEAETSANRDQTGVTFTRAAPGTNARMQYRVFCQEGPNLGTNRYLFSDLTTNAYGILRPSGTGSGDGTIYMRGTTTNTNPVVPTDGDVGRHVAFWSNSVSTDYQQWKNTVSNGQNAGNTAGTGAQTAVTTAGTAWAWISVGLDLDVSFPAGGAPTLLQLSQLDAYAAFKHGAGVLG
jgi:hypothetical protein